MPKYYKSAIVMNIRQGAAIHRLFLGNILDKATKILG